MAISCTNLLIGAVLVGATTLVTAEVVSRQDEPGGGPEAAMEQWMALAQPGAEHARLTQLEGTWHQENKHWMYPGAAPNESIAKAEFKAILGGRFVTQHVTGDFDFGKEKFEFDGMGLYGYDNIENKHFFVWVDNMGTMMITAEGAIDADGNIVYYGTMPDPMAGGTAKVKWILSFGDESSHDFEMHVEQPDGSWFQHMEVASRRTR